MTVLRGDCVEVMAGMEPDSIDAIVTDPPYGLEFMGKEWDRLQPDRTRPDPTGKSVSPFYRPGWGNSRTDISTRQSQEWHQQWATAALRVAKPGAYLLAFGGTRTVHRMTCALEDAGWVIRDMLVWAYAQGFPKSRASLKPAWEPIVMARKPGPSRDLNIEAARIGFASDADRDSGVWGNRGQDTSRHVAEVGSGGQTLGKGWAGTGSTFNEAGRWPANVILTDPIFDGGWEGVVGGGETAPAKRSVRIKAGKPIGNGSTLREWSTAYDNVGGHDDSGTYSRFFLISKAPARERVLPDGRRSPHPTQKPEALIRHLVTLVTPPGGLVLDPFLGSGTLGVVCDGLGMRWLGIEREAEYADWAEDRIADRQPVWSVA